MKPKYLVVITLLLAIFCFSSCEKKTATAVYDRPVVEAYLIPGQALKLKVYYQKYLEDTISYGYPVKGLAIHVSDGNNTVLLTENEPGVYHYDNLDFLKENKSYSLNFSHLDKTVSAQTTIPSKPIGFKASDTIQKVPVFSQGTTPEPFVPITYSWNNPNLDHYLMSFQSIDPYPTNISRSTQLKTEALVGQVSFYNTAQMTFNYSGNYKVLLFHINKEYSDALKSTGGNSLNLTNPLTNVMNGLGIFTGLTADTLAVYVTQ